MATQSPSPVVSSKLAPARVTRAGVAAVTGTLALLAASVVLAVDAAAGPSPLVPGGLTRFPAWLAGPLSGLGRTTSVDGFGVLLVVMLAGWLLVLAGVRAVPARVLVAVIVAAHVVFLLAPPLLSADVFGYVGFARLGALHHLDPYVYGTGWAPGDPVHAYLRWHNAHSPYGPLFTVLSYGLVPLGVAGAVWSFKLLACAASLATVALVWRLSVRLGRDPRPAAVLVGLSPPLLAFEVGGGHNDALVGLVVLGGVALALERRPAAGLGAMVLAVGLKATAGVAAPFALLAAGDRRRALAGAVAAAVAVGAAGVIGFGTHAGASLTAAVNSGRGVAVHSVPSTLARALGTGGVGTGTLVVLALVLLTCVAVLLWRTWRGADWITGAGWATLAVLCTSAWLLPWYATWLMPFAALGDSRRLRVAAVLLASFVTLGRVRALGL